MEIARRVLVILWLLNRQNLFTGTCNSLHEEFCTEFEFDTQEYTFWQFQKSFTAARKLARQRADGETIAKPESKRGDVYVDIRPDQKPTFTSSLATSEGGEQSAEQNQSANVGNIHVETNVTDGSIVKGILRVDQKIGVRPGIVSKTAEGRIQCRPIRSIVLSLCAEENQLQYAVPGGLIGVGTKIDPTLCRADRLVDHVLDAVGTLPDVFIAIKVTFHLLRRLFGSDDKNEKSIKVGKLVKGETLTINIGSVSAVGLVTAIKGDGAKITLNEPVCTEVGEKIALSRRIDKHWRLIGWGKIRRGTVIAGLD